MSTCEKGRSRRNRNILRVLRGEDISLTPAAPIRTHLLALLGLHWGVPAIVAATSHTATVGGVTLLARGDSVMAERKHLAAFRLPLTVAVPPSVPDHLFVPALGAQRRVSALLALGYRHEDLTPLIGRDSRALTRNVQPVTRVRAGTWRAIDATYRALEFTPGPSENARWKARAVGHAPPAAWDDIDNPAAHADTTGACGTPLGATRHIAAQTRTCDPCRDARNTAARERRAA